MLSDVFPAKKKQKEVKNTKLLDFYKYFICVNALFSKRTDYDKTGRMPDPCLGVRSLKQLRLRGYLRRSRSIGMRLSNYLTGGSHLLVHDDGGDGPQGGDGDITAPGVGRGVEHLLEIHPDGAKTINNS